MNVRMGYLIALIVRGEGSKTPVIVFPHEVDLLRVVHGDEAVLVTDDVSPVKDATFDTEDEYVRLELTYGDAVRGVFRNLAEFESKFEPDDGKDALIEQAIALGIDANKRWGVAKLQEAIAAAGE